MNYNRLRARVWDKQEKKMLYQGDKFNSNHYGNSPYELIGIDSRGLITLDPWKHEINIIPFGDRYIPMLCAVLKDKNKKLIYEADILRVPSKCDWDKVNFSSYEVLFCDNDSLEDHIGFRMNRVHYHGSVSGGWVPNFNPKTTSRMEIIGNKFLNPELLEQQQ